MIIKLDTCQKIIGFCNKLQLLLQKIALSPPDNGRYLQENVHRRNTSDPIPAKFREQLGPSFTLCFAPHVPALVLYPDEVWKEISDRINASLFDEQMRKVQRRTMSSAFDIEADKQGRITIPAIFKRYAKLESECIISGAGRKVEIWNPDAWYEEFTRKLDLPEGEDDFGVSYDFGSVLER